MSLEEIDNIISSMEQSLNEIKNYQVIYKELSELQCNISQSVEDLKANKESLDNLNTDITSSIENLKKQVENLNTLLPQKMLEIISSNKDIQLDIKNKYEELIKIFTKFIDNVLESNNKISCFIKKQNKICIFLTVAVIINLVLSIVCVFNFVIK